MRAWLPAALVAVSAFWCGTFHDGTGAWASTVATALPLLLAFLLSLDPMASRGKGVPSTGSRGGASNWRLAVAILGALVLLSWWASPVPRAGRAVVLLLPAWLLLPAALAACWRSEGARRRGLAVLGAVVAAASLWALVDRFGAGSERAALPLGHHNLLAVWLVTLLPLAALGARGRGLNRWLAAAAALLGAAALVATGSLAGTLALALQISVAAVFLGPGRKEAAALGTSEVPASVPVRNAEKGAGQPGETPGAASASKSRRRLPGVALFLVLALLAAIPRLSGLLAGRDASWQARGAYLAAGWEGLLERPLLGWGPGSTPWTVAEFLKPAPGVQPPGELVGDLHNLPLQLAYELGLPAAALCLLLAAAFLWRRRIADAKDAPMAAAAKLGCLGFAVASLGGASLAVAALPFALAMAVAALLAAAPGAHRPLAAQPSRWRAARWAPALYASAAALALAPSLRAHHAYDRASESVNPRPGLEQAVRWDPDFPLYRIRYAALTQDAEEAQRAAAGAPAVAAHWLLAGALGQQKAHPAARKALLHACRLDPLSGLAAFLYASEAPDEAAESLARALLAEPRLLAASELLGTPGLLERVVERIRKQPGVDEGLRARWVEVAAQIPRDSGIADGLRARSRLAQTCDGRPALALSTFLFRRRPWPLELASVEVDAELAGWLDLPSASLLPSTAPWVFARGSCGLGEP